MDFATYQQRVLARASHRWHNEKLDAAMLEAVLTNYISWGQLLDKVKKSLMYGRDFYNGQEPAGELICVPPEKDQRLIHAMLGIATEGVEMMEAVRDYFFGNGFNGYEALKRFDLTNLQEEFGDVFWYYAFGLKELGQSDAENRAQNDAKLEKRFGAVFSEDKANNRDLDAERRTLEEGK